MSSETSTSPNLPRIFRRLGRYFWGGTTYLPTALHGGEVVGSGRTPTSTSESSGEVGRSSWAAPSCSSPRSNHGDGRGCDDDHCPRHGNHDGPQAILRDAAGRVLAFDPDLAADLSDLANDYAGLYTPEETK